MENKLKTLSEKIQKHSFMTDEGISVINTDMLDTILEEFIRLLKEEISDINKHMDLHNVDECDCCEKNWKSIYESLEIIDKLAGSKLTGANE